MHQPVKFENIRWGDEMAKEVVLEVLPRFFGRIAGQRRD
jgi:hypothetical protein